MTKGGTTMRRFTDGPHVVASLGQAPGGYEVRTADGARWVCRCNRRADAVLHATAADLLTAVRGMLNRHRCHCEECRRARLVLERVAEIGR